MQTLSLLGSARSLKNVLLELPLITKSGGVWYVARIFRSQIPKSQDYEGDFGGLKGKRKAHFAGKGEKNSRDA